MVGTALGCRQFSAARRAFNLRNLRDKLRMKYGKWSAYGYNFSGLVVLNWLRASQLGLSEVEWVRTAPARHR